MRFLTLFLLLFSFSSYAEIYKWTDANGKVHFSDEPHETIESEATGIEPAVKMGSVVPQKSSAGSSLLRNDINSQKAAKRKSIANAEQGKRDKERLRQKCSSLNAQIADYRDMRNSANNSTMSGYYDGHIARLSRRAKEACKLSNFR